MNSDLRKLVLLNPELLHYLDLHGAERAALAFDILISAASRDSSGHYYSPDGAPCPHKKGSAKTQPRETPASVARKEAGVHAIKGVLSGGAERAEMQTAAGRKVIIERGTAKYGIEHFRLRRYNSGDAKTDAEFDRIIDGVAKAIATVEPKNITNTGKTLFDYNGYRAICDERNEDLVFISGYKIHG